MFCTIRGLETLGTAKVLEATGTQWQVQYFDGPSRDGLKSCNVHRDRVHRQLLGANTRIHYHDPATGNWLLGRVQQDVDEHVEVRFANKTDVVLPHSDVYVRWKSPICDPVEYLSRGITETPRYAEARRGFLSNYIAQRGAAGGISALLSSAIELNPHQLDVVRRVLSDASQRYLLADEVGLGKTIEAAVIVRQAVLDDPVGHSVVILVPPSLVSQWRLELLSRFGLGPYLDISVHIFPHEKSSALEEALDGASMLVVDEAHHLAAPKNARDSGLYDLVNRASTKVQRLLLLSATPVLRNETGFLRMLHLLDPLAYDLKDTAGFKQKILHRQSLAEAVATLDPENALQIEPILDHLIETLPGDERLSTLISALRAKLVGIPDPEDEALVQAVNALRAHLSETYRLNRRILRNRRRNVHWLTPNRAGVVAHYYSSAASQRIDGALENWRIECAASLKGKDGDHASDVQEFYWHALNKMFTGVRSLEEICIKRAAANRLRASSPTTTDETAALVALGSAAREHRSILIAKVDQLCQLLEAAERDSTKLVVFCSALEDGDDIFELVERSGWRGKTVRHELSDDEFESAPSWTKFHSDSRIVAIICDNRAEEGLNLQGGRKAIVHFDLPLDPNRIEQRIGRLDRYGTGTPVRSIVLLDKDSALQKCWLELLENGLDVFGRSISSLQYLVEEQIHALRKQLVLEGVEAMSSLANALGGNRGLVERELRLINQQDALDALAPQSETDLDAVADVDDDWQGIRLATETWVSKTLMFDHVLVPGATSKQSVDPPFRFKYLKPEVGQTSTLLPLSGFLGDFLGALDYEAKGSSSRQPLSYAHSYHRKTAIKYGVRPLRYGSEFVEAIKSFSDIDDRGRSFAIWRQVRNGFPEEAQQMYFCFDFFVEVDLAVVRDILTTARTENIDVAMRAVSRRADSFFAPFVQRIWIDENGLEPQAEFRNEYLDRPYDQNGSDTNLRTARLLNLVQGLTEIFGNWSFRCMRSSEVAKKVLAERPILKNTVEVARRRFTSDVETRRAQLATRIQQLRGKEQREEQARSILETQIDAALIAGIAQPSIQVDLAGMVLLATESYANVEKALEVR